MPSSLSVKYIFLFVQVKPHYFARCLMEWSEKGFPELDDVCGNGICPQIKAVISHPQFSEEPEKVNYSRVSKTDNIIPSNAIHNH